MRRILLAEGVHWRNTRPWAESAYLRSSSQKVLWIVGLYTNPPPNSTVVCVEELGPITPRFFAPAPGWSPDGHRIKDGTSLTFISRSRNSKGYIKLLQKVERAIPEGIRG